MSSMNGLFTIIVGFVMVVGIIGIVVPALPGVSLVVGALVVWGAHEGTGIAWVVVAVGVLIGVAGTVVKYLVPKRRLSEADIPSWTVVLATVVAIAGFFMVPVVGAPVGFVATIYVFERIRLDAHRAWRATTEALRAYATSIGIELAAGFSIVGVWIGFLLLR